MKVYKKLFSYVGIEKLHGVIAILFSIASMIMVALGFYSVYRFTSALVISGDFKLAEGFAVETAIRLTIGAILYLLSGLFSHLLGFRLETNLRKKDSCAPEKSNRGSDSSYHRSAAIRHKSGRSLPRLSTGY